MATARRNGNGGQGGKANPWARGIAALVSAALIGAPLPVLSQPSDLADLKNQSEDYASEELSRRGFFLTQSLSRQNAIHQFWWSSSRDYCVRIALERNRVTEVKSSDDHDCNQRRSGSKGTNKGAQVAIAAAAILGVAVLAHKSQDSNKERANQSPEEVAEFERGYRDGLYHQGYHNYNNRSNYSDGYQKGQEARSSETAYRSNQGHHSGYAAYVNVNDLVGARAAGAESDLQARGFRNTSGYKANDRAYTYWWNGSTRQCVNAAVFDGRMESVQSTAETYCQK
jgi:hypothetical protein